MAVSELRRLNLKLFLAKSHHLSYKLYLYLIVLLLAHALFLADKFWAVLGQ